MQTKACAWGAQAQKEEGTCPHTIKSLAELGQEPRAPDSPGLRLFLPLSFAFSLYVYPGSLCGAPLTFSLFFD